MGTHVCMHTHTCMHTFQHLSDISEPQRQTSVSKRTCWWQSTASLLGFCRSLLGQAWGRINKLTTVRTYNQILLQSELALNAPGVSGYPVLISHGTYWNPWGRGITHDQRVCWLSFILSPRVNMASHRSEDTNGKVQVHSQTTVSRTPRPHFFFFF